jgi:hypothetical protein
MGKIGTIGIALHMNRKLACRLPFDTQSSRQETLGIQPPNIPNHCQHLPRSWMQIVVVVVAAPVHRNIVIRSRNCSCIH